MNEKGYSTAVGDEGGFAPKLKSNREALELIAMAIEKTGYRLGQDVFLALDVAATELYDNGQYKWEGKNHARPIDPNPTPSGAKHFRWFLSKMV